MNKINQKLFKIIHFIPSLDKGGAERQLTFLATEQVRKGYSVIVATRRKGYFYKELKKNNVKLEILGDYKSIDLRLLIKIIKLIKFHNPIVVQTWLQQMNVMGGLASLIKKKIWVATERTNEKFYLNSFNLIFFLQKIILPRASALIVNSNNALILWKKKILKKKIYLVNNSIDFSLMNKFKRKKILDNKLKILSVGRFEESKGFSYIIKSIKYIPKSVDLNLKIIGYGKYKFILKKIIAKLNLEKKIRLLSDKGNWFKHLENSDAFVSMSNFEGQPNTILEAAAASCPLILSDIPEHKAIFNKNSAIYVPLKNPKKLSEAILFFRKSSKYSKKIIKNAKLCIKNMSISNQFSEHHKIYKKLIKCNNICAQ